MQSEEETLNLRQCPMEVQSFLHFVPLSCSLYKPTSMSLIVLTDSYQSIEPDQGMPEGLSECPPKKMDWLDYPEIFPVRGM